MLKTTLLCLASLSFTLAAGPKFTIQPKAQPNMCVDTKPLAGSPLSYASLQPCAFKKDGTPVVTQLFQFDSGSPLVDDVKDKLYGFYPDGTRACFGGFANASPSPFADGDPPRVAACSGDAYQYQWWFSNWGEEGLQIRKAKAGRYGQDLALDLRPKTRTGGAQTPTPFIWRVGSEKTQRWTVKMY